MPHPAKYEYRGVMYTVAQLSKISGVSEGIMRKRLRTGWCVEDAVEIRYEPRYKVVDESLRGKTLLVYFAMPLASVVSEMQPILHKPYIAVPRNNQERSHRNKDYYVIQLDNGKPLIVYPHEFEVIRAAEGE